MILYNFSIGLENVRKLRPVSTTTALQSCKSCKHCTAIMYKDHVHQNPNYCYIQEMVFNFLYALMLFRKGCSCSYFCAEITLHAHYCSQEPHGITHYSEIVHYDLKQYMRCPLALKEIVLGSVAAITLAIALSRW